MSEQCPACQAPMEADPHMFGYTRCSSTHGCNFPRMPTDVWRRLAAAVALAGAVERVSQEIDDLRPSGVVSVELMRDVADRPYHACIVRYVQGEPHTIRMADGDSGAAALVALAQGEKKEKDNGA